MKKLLLTTILTLTVSSAVFAATDDTYTGALLNSFQKKIDATAAPVVNREAQIRAQQRSLTEQRQRQVSDRQREIEAQQQAQQELVNKKRQQIQAQKDLLNNEKNELKGIFSVK